MPEGANHAPQTATESAIPGLAGKLPRSSRLVSLLPFVPSFFLIPTISVLILSEHYDTQIYHPDEH
jgi:hypothetical protein